MGVEIASERKLLTGDEYGPVAQSHFPALDALPHEELVALAQWLRARRDRSRDLVRDRRRVRRGKADGKGADGATGERNMAAKKQVFARGLKRVNGKLAALAAERKRAEATARLRAALEGKRAARVHHPLPGMDAGGGMSVVPSGKRRRIVQGGRIGSTSQATRNAQARRDAR